MFNLTGRRRSADVAVQLRLTALAERALARRMKAAITRAAQEAADAHSAGGQIGTAIANHHAEVERILVASYTATMYRMGKRVFDGVGKATRHMERKDKHGVFQRSVSDWIALYTARKVESISGTTMAAIKDAIREGEAAGMGYGPTAKLITEQTGGLIAASRAAIIARTEVHAAAVYGQDAAINALDVPEVKKEWISIEDERTRESHAEANGQIVGIDEAFNVGGASLDLPGDPSGPIEETINCRCVVGYIAPGFE